MWTNRLIFPLNHIAFYGLFENARVREHIVKLIYWISNRNIIHSDSDSISFLYFSSEVKSFLDFIPDSFSIASLGQVKPGQIVMVEHANFQTMSIPPQVLHIV